MMYIYKSAHIVSVEVAMFQKQHPCVTSIQLKKQNMTSTSEAPSISFFLLQLNIRWQYIKLANPTPPFGAEPVKISQITA